MILKTNPEPTKQNGELESLLDSCVFLSHCFLLLLLRLIFNKHPQIRKKNGCFPCSHSPPSFSPSRSADGILPTPQFSTRLFFPFRHSDSPPSLSRGRFDDGIFPNSSFFTRLPPHSCLRQSGSSPWQSGPPQPASVTPVSRVAIDPLGTFPFLFSPSLPPAAYTFSSAASCPRVCSNSFSPPPLLALALCITSLSSSSSSSSRPVYYAKSYLC